MGLRGSATTRLMIGAGRDLSTWLLRTYDK
jgi:hypothetical protein